MGSFVLAISADIFVWNGVVFQEAVGIVVRFEISKPPDSLAKAKLFIPF